MGLGPLIMFMLAYFNKHMGIRVNKALYKQHIALL